MNHKWKKKLPDSVEVIDAVVAATAQERGIQAGTKAYDNLFREVIDDISSTIKH
ncbi:MAG TPA: hypothetical protein P5205_08340 [Candidatus Paceibacterota bacterium]|nr:hypothetical protein [Verrucomicrobiota bacterium]HSA10366.1 hypothetical protein [Candidatus Paceibacterota bacterium]